MQWQKVLRWACPVVAAGMASGIVFLRVFLERFYASASMLPPTKRQLETEDLDANPLSRSLPALRGKLAWRQLGEYPTPVHRFSCSLPGQGSDVDFWVKREDLSSARYGGNKVRTLQYLLGCFEAHAENSGKLGRIAKLLTLGSGGSNQVLATKTHAAFLPLPANAVEGFTPMPDEPEMDNTLNFLSAMSVPGVQHAFGTGWGSFLAALRLLPSRDDGTAPWVIMPGGNNPLGVLGQAGAALELAEQIVRGEAPDPDGIVVAMGSTCTTTGLVLGVTLARYVGLRAFNRPGFRIYAQPVHPGMSKMQAFLGALTSRSWPMTIGRGLRETSALIARLGGPDVTDHALACMRETLVISHDLDITGKYGAHSAASKAAKARYDESVSPPPGAPHLWLCGHFSAKSFALLLKLLDKEPQQGERRRLLFWQTKSSVQPKGGQDEWSAWQDMCRTNKPLAKWGVVGGVTGHPTSVGGLSGVSDEVRKVAAPEDYLGFMTPVQFPAAES